MLIVQARAMGMCFGVEDALAITDSLQRPQEIAILGELVHNGQVQRRLLERGFASQAENARRQLPPQPAVLVTAHGISEVYRNRLRAAGKEIIDTTCPLVVRVHKSARHLAQHGYRLILVGKPGHVEVLGITEDYPETLVVPGLEQVPAGLTGRLALLAQTTTPPHLYQQVLERLQHLNPGAEIRPVDTICKPTRERQQASVELLEKVQALVVVGGAHSNNSLRLLEQAQRHGLPGWRVECAEELQPDWFAGLKLVGLTAGTSTPQAAIDGVHRRLLQIGRSLAAASPSRTPAA